ncbi:MAG: hypothetical protein K6T26_03875 [Alicyclobacillus sp.]|nr:hypothetical protein [Alicyclobacillus sp.]
MNEGKDTFTEKAHPRAQHHQPQAGNLGPGVGGLKDRTRAQVRRRRWRQALSWGTLLVAVAGFAGLWNTVRHAVLPTASRDVAAAAGMAGSVHGGSVASQGVGGSTAGSGPSVGAGDGDVSGLTPIPPRSDSGGYVRHRHRVARSAGDGTGWSGIQGSGSAGIAAGDAQQPNVRSSAS